MNVTDKSALRECTSCQLCAAVCPKEAISISLNENGFYRPIADVSKCINCGICLNVCYKFDPCVMTTSETDLKKMPLYSAWSKDDSLVKISTSGGLGDLLARQLIHEGYKVAGVSYNDDMARAEHIIATSEEETQPFRGSKYIQSYTLNAMKQIVKSCKHEKYAVFGTPCQIYALNKLAELYKVRDNFFFVDLYCHGCPSLHIWTKYQTYIKKKYGVSHFDQLNFRSKVKGWGGFYIIQAFIKDDSVFTSSPKEDGFYELFFSDMLLNDGCHECKLRSSLEYTDIRLGDFWGKMYLSNHRGVSGVSLSSLRGKHLFARIEEKIDSRLCDYSDFLSYQSWGKVYAPNAQIRKELIESLNDNNQTIVDTVEIYRRYQGLIGKMRRYVKSVLYYLPISFTTLIKRIVL